MAEISLESLYHLVENMADYLMTQVATKEDLGLLAQRVDSLAEQLDRLTQRVDSLAERIDRLGERVDRLTERVESLTKRVDSLAERIDRLEERVDRLTERVDSLAERIDRLEERVDRLTERVDILTIRLDALEQEFRSFRIEITGKFNQVLEGMDAQAGQLDILTTELASQSHTLELYNVRTGNLEEALFGKRVRDEKDEGSTTPQSSGTV